MGRSTANKKSKAKRKRPIIDPFKVVKKGLYKLSKEKLITQYIALLDNHMLACSEISAQDLKILKLKDEISDTLKELQNTSMQTSKINTEIGKLNKHLNGMVGIE